MLFRAVQGLRTFDLYPHIKAISRAQSVAYSEVVPSLWSDFPRFGGRVPSIRTLTLKLFRMLFFVAKPQYVHSL